MPPAAQFSARPAIIAGCALLALALPVAAHADDPRLVTHLWRANGVTRLESRAGVESTIAFGEAEHIENVAIGDANLWQVVPNKRANMLFVKPLASRAHTNLTVVTDQHSYFLELVARPLGRATYLLRFTYPPAPPAPPPPAALTHEESAITQGQRPVAGLDPAALDFGWHASGKAALLPARVFSDGQSTYLGWAAGVSLPAILAVDAKGAEGPVNYTVAGDLIVVDGVPGRLVLRSGRDRAVVEHVAGVPAGAPQPAAPQPAAPAAPAAATRQEG